jgi:hypothetical protein
MVDQTALSNFMEGLRSLLAEVVREAREAQPQNNGDDDLQLYDAEETAGLLGLPNRDSVYRLRDLGKLHAVNLGGDNGKTVRFRRSEIRRYLEELEAKDEPNH